MYKTKQLNMNQWYFFRKKRRTVYAKPYMNEENGKSFRLNMCNTLEIQTVNTKMKKVR